MYSNLSDLLGVVVIGRNEGERLRACWDSLAPFELSSVYVDSGSTDRSLKLAESFSAQVLQLDPAIPFTAARARREGCQRLLERRPELQYIFFVDGDCVVDAGWPRVAVEALNSNAQLAAVCGRRREKSPDESWYNEQCDYEWDTPIGECTAVGGDAVYRTAAYCEARGFDATVPAGEEPELCQRLRRKGWRLERLDAAMTEHDAAITRFSQWWRRQLRTGYGGQDVERRFGLGLFDHLIRGAYFWSAIYPASVVLAVILGGVCFGPSGAVSAIALGLLGLVLQSIRIARVIHSGGRSWGAALRIALLTMLAKMPIALGALRSTIGNLRGAEAKIVEYKTADSSPPRAAAPSKSSPTMPSDAALEPRA